MIRLATIMLAASATTLFAQAPPAQAPAAQPTHAPAPHAPAPVAPAPAAPAQLTQASATQVSTVRSVYILPMAGGLDQYLAEHLTQTGAMQVVTDPKAADSFLTDHLGEPFEQKIAEFHQPADAAKNSNNAVHPSFRSTNSKGTVFLVDAKSQKVLWSDYEKPGPHDSATLNHVAARIVQKMTVKPK